jgi:GNAT superfamily N-acetyltransferase
MTVSPRSRQLRSSELGNFVDELDNWLRPDQSWSLRDEFPQVFGPRSRAQHFVLDLGDETVAHAAALDLDMRVHGRSWHPRLVGSVVVDPHHRGLGLGRAVMEEVVRNFESSSREALVLWSDKPGFYAKLGFEPFGHEFHVSVDGHGVEAPEPRAELRPARERDLEELLLLHLGKPIHSARSLGDFESFVRIPDCKTYVADRDGHVVAYACIGKASTSPTSPTSSAARTPTSPGCFANSQRTAQNPWECCSPSGASPCCAPSKITPSNPPPWRSVSCEPRPKT